MKILSGPRKIMWLDPIRNNTARVVSNDIWEDVWFTLEVVVHRSVWQDIGRVIYYKSKS